LDNNTLNELPNELGQCPQLLTLDASHNHLRSLPRLTNLTARLTNLTALLLNDNPLQSLPPDLKRLTNIIDLKIKITDLGGIKTAGADVQDEGPKLPPMEIILRGEDAILSYAGKLRDGAASGKLDLGELGLRQVPGAVLKLSTLTSLRISELHQLKSISFGGCSRLTALPVKMGRLTNLSRLNLDGVKLVEDVMDYLARFDEAAMNNIHLQLERFPSLGVEDVMDYLARFDEAAMNNILDLVDIGLNSVPIEALKGPR
ncbi:hypothetical protein T484DRAFT_1792160, partial [Baffinella frigidus]